MKRPLIAVLFLFFLLVGALSAWTWLAPSRSTSVPRVAQEDGNATGEEKPRFEIRPQQRAATKTEKQGAIRSIRAQLDAFRRDDYQSAARYQSQNLRRNFGSIAAFQNIIKKSYPQFANYQSVSFGSITAHEMGDVVSINVPINLIGQDGVKVQATYNMIRENGVYCVSGVSGGTEQGAPSDKQTPKVPSGFEDVAPLIT